MVSIRRVKYVFKLLIVSTIVFCLIFFHKWKEDISYQAKVRRYFEEIREQDDQQLIGDKKNWTVHDSYNYLIVEQAQELDVDQILKKLKDDFSNREVTLKNKSVQVPEDVAKVNEKGFQMSSGQNETSKLAAVNVTLKSENDSKVHSKHSHKFKNETFKWKKMQWQPSMRGKLNVHIWQAWCGSTTHDLRRSKFFPQWPDLHLTSDQFFIHHGEEDFGQRIFGYLHPPVTGKYRFAIASDDSSELWISTDDSPLNVRLVSWVGNLTSLEGAFNTEVAQFTKYPTQISRPLFLDQGKKYFVEVLHKQARDFDHIMVGWKVPGMAGLRHISGKSISLYINDTQLANDVTEYAKYIPMDLPSHSHHEVLKVQLESTIHSFATVDPYDKRHKSSLVNNSHIAGLFPSCDYFPSYLVDFKLKRYQGVQLIHDTAIYPDDNTDLIHMKQFDKCRIRRYKDSHGNKVPTSVSLTKLNNDSLYGSGGRIKVKLLKEEVDEEFKKEILQFDGGNPEDILPLNKLNKRKGRKNIAIVSQQTNAIPNYSIKKKKGLKKLPKTKKEQKPSRKVSTFQYSTDKNMSPKIRHLLSVEVETNMIQKKYKERLEAARQRRLRIAHEQRKAVAGSSRHRTGTRTSHSVHISHKYASTVSRHMPDRRSRVSQRETTMSQRRLPPWLMPTDSAENFMYRFRSAWSYVRQILKMVYHDNFKVNITSLERNVYRRWNIRLKVPSTFYAEDFTAWIFHQNSSKCGSDPNLLLSENVAQSVVYRYMKALKKKFGSLYSLKKILNVEENHDILKGDRYLVELELNVKGQENPVRLSQFIYQKIGETSFCLPKGFVLNPHSTVHVIVPVKNQGKWVQYLIEDMSEIYRKTRDPHFNLIIVDFDSNDIDIEAALHRSDLKRYQLIKLKGPFQRALGIQVGTEAVTGNHDIIFTCDLHLDTPVNLIDIIRKHCVEGKMAFAPIVNRLHCGFTPSLPYGFWELQGYGLFAIYKSDYQRIGGMNYREFKTQWGGEDWEMLDRVLAKKIEVERLRIARFYHFFHSKKGMWGEKNLADTALVNKAGGSSSQNGRIVLFEEDPSYYKFAGRRTTTRRNKIPTKISTIRKQRKGTAKVANNH